MKILFYKIYRQITPILFVPLLLTALTGIIYKISKHFFKLPELITKALITIHQGLFLGEKIASFYALFMGLGVFALGLKALIESKKILSSWQHTHPNSSSIFRLIILILAIPLAFCVETGVAYQLGRDWFGMSNQQKAVFLNIHGGNALGIIFGTIYILIAGLGLIALSIIGYKMTSVSVGQRQHHQQFSLPEKITPAYILGSNYSEDDVNESKKDVRLGIASFSLLFIIILYAATSRLIFSVVIIGLVFVVPALLIAEKLIQSWQKQKKLQAKLYERESESVTMLKAIPDSMLRMSQEGKCLSYMPAKEGKSFVLDGDIVNKHISEFLTIEIAQEFLKFAQLSLATGSTHFHRFMIALDNEEQYYEARISPMGQSEVLIMVREVANFDDTSIEIGNHLENNQQNGAIQLLNESELTEILENILQDIRANPQNHILFCLAIKQTEIQPNGSSHIDENLMYQIIDQINVHLASNVIARLDNNCLVMLVKDCSLQQASVLVQDLRQSLNEFSAASQNGASTIKVNVGLLEMNINNSDAVSIMNAAKTTCDMAQQKVNVKTFW